MLAPLAEAGPEDPMLGLAVRARDYYAELGPALVEEVGIDIGVHYGGILEVAFSEDEVVGVKKEVAWHRQCGFAAEWLSANELHELAPGIAPEALGAAYAPEDGALNPLALLQALAKSAREAGAEFYRGEEVKELLIDGSTVRGVRTTVTNHEAEVVLVAGGAWSGQIAGLPRPLSVRPVRGQMASMIWPEGCPKMIVYGAGGYVMPQAGGAVAGSTMENAGFEVTVTEAGLDHIRSVVNLLLPELGDVLFSRTWVGLRPCTPDGRPIIGPDPYFSGLWYATGHGRNGILLAGYTGELVAQLHFNDEIELDLNPISPARFWDWKWLQPRGSGRTQ
jgi:glycine oxidase